MTPRERMKQRIEEAKGHYSFPFSGNSFEGKVIKLDKESFNLFFQTCSDGDEGKFCEKLERMDMWFEDKPHKVYADNKWITLVAKWLKREKENGLG